ncbi:hypothetical protein PMAYCL1PPCAC_18409, partial [Pristionchus mayeri]
IQLEDALSFDDTVSPVCLPSINTSIQEDSIAIATGKRWKLLSGDNIIERQLCAGSYGHGTAPGDSGGPLVMNSKSGRWFQIGLTSFGLNNDKYLIEQDISPGVYTNIKYYCDWIEVNTRGDSKCQNAELIDASS